LKEPNTIALEESADGVIVAGNNESYLGLHAQCPIFFPIFSKFGFFSSDINKSTQYKISRKSTQSGRAYAYEQMDGHDESNMLSPRLRERAQKPVRLFSDSYDILNEELPNASL
jgi:hypothetical protein